MDEHISLWAKNNRKGVSIPQAIYVRLTHFIVKTLRTTAENKKTLVALIEEVTSSQLHGLPQTTSSWYLLHVKQDLEERGILRTSINREKAQEIHLAPSYRKRLKDLRLPVVDIFQE